MILHKLMLAGIRGCERIFTDKIRGSFKKREGLNDALSHLRNGDKLVEWKLDQLGRTVKQLVDLVADLSSKGINFQSLTYMIPDGRFFFHIMASLSQMERELTAERTRAGLGIAKNLGRAGGRRPIMTTSKVQWVKKLLRSGKLPKQVADDLGISLATLYRWVPAAASQSRSRGKNS